jgi:hypothetical protein
VRQALSLVLVFLFVTRLAPTALGAEDVAGQITGMRVGTNIEVWLKDKQTLRGVAGSGFTLVNPSGGDRKIAFDDGSSVKQWNKKSHTTRNVLIVGVGIVVFVPVMAIYITHHPLG